MQAVHSAGDPAGQKKDINHGTKWNNHEYKVYACTRIWVTTRTHTLSHKQNLAYSHTSKQSEQNSNVNSRKHTNAHTPTSTYTQKPRQSLYHTHPQDPSYKPTHTLTSHTLTRTHTSIHNPTNTHTYRFT